MNTPPESAQTQCERLLAHLKLGLPLTAHKALYGYSCLRLAARIHDLKQMGHQIEKRMVEVAALELVRGNVWVCQQLGEGARAVETEEI